MFFRKQKQQPQETVGAEIAFCVPSADGGWRVLQGFIVAYDGVGLNVRERYFGVHYTINLEWVVGYVWPVKQHAPALASAR